MSKPTLPFEVTDDLLVAVVRVRAMRSIYVPGEPFPWPTVSVPAKRSVTLGNGRVIEYRDGRYWLGEVPMGSACSAAYYWSSHAEADKDVVRLIALRAAEPVERRITDDEARQLLDLARAKWPEAGI